MRLFNPEQTHAHMAHVVEQQSALDELILQGVAQPTWQLAPMGLSYVSHASPHPFFDYPDDDDGQSMCLLRWNEPMQGRNPQDPYSGFDPNWVSSSKFRDHSITLYDVNASDGIEVCQARAIFSNLYRNTIHGGVDNNTLQSLQTFGMELWVSTDANLDWYSPGGNDIATCIYKELDPMPYETFKKTFRYFLLRYTTTETETERPRFKVNVLPTTATQPDEHWFDKLANSDSRSVQLGLNNETAAQAWAHLPGKGYIERETFNHIWALYRSGRILWQKVRRFLKMRCVGYYWASLAAQPDAAGNAPPGAIDAFHQEF